MKKRGIIAIVAVIVVGAIIYFSVRGGGDKGEKVYAEPAKLKKIEAVVTAPGEVDPKFKVNISAHVIGKIDRLHFNEGDMVKKGQVLIELERQSFGAQRDSTRAQLESRRIEVIRARAQLENAQHAYDRASSLKQQGIQAQEAFDQARLNLDNARAAYASSQQAVQQASATIVQAETDLSYTTITAPVTGKVVQLNTREGEVVIPGTMNNPGSVLAVIADMSEILVAAEVGESEVVGIKIGQPAKIHVDAVANYEYLGHVSEIGSSAAIRSGAGGGVRYFKVKIAIDNPDDRLRPGMSSQVSIVTSTAGDAIAVPIQSVVERVPGAKKGDDEDEEGVAKKKYVLVVKDDKVKQTEVTTGISDATHVAITSGIKAGDIVITGPFRLLKKLHDGDSVEVVKEEKKSSTDEEKTK